jgi:proteasome accessory factor C
MPESALDRVSRALDLIPFLVANPGLSISGIAQEFSSTAVQISNDLSLLHMCGLPGYSHLELLDISYEDPEFIEVVDPQVLDKPRSLTSNEAMSLVLGLQVLKQMASNPEQAKAIGELSVRISSKLDSEILSKVLVNEAVVGGETASVINTALRSTRSIVFTYYSAISDLTQVREVWPQELSFRNGIGYLKAATPGKAEYRTFRLDRISEVRLGEPFSLPAHQIALESSYSPVIKIGAYGFFFGELHRDVISEITREGENYLLTFDGVNSDWLLRTLVGIPGKVEVVDPPELAVSFTSRLAEMKSLYGYAQGIGR